MRCYVFCGATYAPRVRYSMQKIDTVVWKETLYIALWTAIFSAIMQAVYLVIGYWDVTVLLGNLLGGAAIVLNYFMIGVTVQRALDKEEKEAKQTIKTSASLRTLYLFLVALVGGLVDVFAIIPLLLCFFFPRLAIMIRPLVDRRTAKKEANSDEE